MNSMRQPTLKTQGKLMQQLRLWCLVCLGAMGADDTWSLTRPDNSSAPSRSSGTTMPTDSSVRTQAAEIKQLQQLLGDPDPAVRLSAIDQLTAATSLAAQEVGFAAGFASADAAVRSVALRRRLAQMTVLSFDVLEVNSADGIAPQKVLDKMARQFSYSVVGRSDRAETIYLGQSVGRSRSARSADMLSVSGLNAALRVTDMNPQCSGTLQLDDSNALVGLLKCSYDNIMRSSVTIRASVKVY